MRNQNLRWIVIHLSMIIIIIIIIMLRVIPPVRLWSIIGIPLMFSRKIDLISIEIGKRWLWNDIYYLFWIKNIIYQRVWFLKPTPVDSWWSSSWLPSFFYYGDSTILSPISSFTWIDSILGKFCDVFRSVSGLVTWVSGDTFLFDVPLRNWSVVW